MTQEEIKRHRVESVLKEIIPEALSTLDDSMINSLLVTDVVCSKGRSDAKVYLDIGYLTPKEQQEALRKLHTISGYVQNHCKQAEGWFKAPKMTFFFDDQPEQIQKIETLFKKIQEEKEGKKDDS